MNLSDEEVLDELYRIAQLRGIKQDAARQAIEKARDKRQLLRRWKRTYGAESRRIIAATERKAMERICEVNAEHHLAVREQARQDLEQRRKRMRLGQRLDMVIAEASVLADVDSAWAHGMVPGAMTRGNGDGMLLPMVERILDLGDFLFIIEQRIKAMEQRLDNIAGRAGGERFTTMTGDEKDAILLSKDMEGRSPDVIADAFPWLGSPEVIKKKRRQRGLRAGDGRPRAEARRAA